jgi:hypothetical protein
MWPSRALAEGQAHARSQSLTQRQKPRCPSPTAAEKVAHRVSWRVLFPRFDPDFPLPGNMTRFPDTPTFPRSDAPFLALPFVRPPRPPPPLPLPSTTPRRRLLLAVSSCRGQGVPPRGGRRFYLMPLPARISNPKKIQCPKNDTNFSCVIPETAVRFFRHGNSN